MSDFLRSPLFKAASAGLLLAAVLVFTNGCGAIDDFNSYVACQQYCDKNFQCLGISPDNDQVGECISNCRDSIENHCGDEHQAAANDHILDCVDLGCPGFWTCMVFDSAPECYGFVTNWWLAGYRLTVRSAASILVSTATGRRTEPP